MTDYPELKPIRECMAILGLPIIFESNGELGTYCVFKDCDKDSSGKEAHLNISEKEPVFSCTKCNTKGHLSELAKHLGMYDAIKLNQFIPSAKKKPTTPFDVTLVEKYHLQLLNNKSKVKYLNDRLITNDMIISQKLGYGSDGKFDRYMIPIKDKDGNYVYFKTRKDNDNLKDENRYKTYPSGESQIYEWETLKSNNKIFICEGEFDCLVLKAKGINAITSTHGSGTFKQEWKRDFNHCREIYIVYDNDDSGKKGARTVASLLYSNDTLLYNILLPHIKGKKKVDVTDFFLSGGTVDELLKRAKPIILQTEEDLKELPENIDIEFDLLKAILTDNKLLFRVVDSIFEEDFYYQNFGILYKLIKEIISEGNSTDEIVLKSKINSYGKVSVLNELSRFYPIIKKDLNGTQVGEWAECIKEKAVRRSLISIGNEVVGSGYKEVIKPDSIISSAFNNLLSLRELRNKRVPLNMKDSINEAIEIINKKGDNPDKYGGIESGYKDLDNILWGFHNQELIYLAAKPRVGKTTFLLNMFTNMASKGKRVLLFSIEMKRDLVVSRILSSKTFIKGSEFRRGIRADSLDKMDKIKEAQKEYENIDFIIDDNSLDIDNLPSLAHKYKIMYGIDIIGIDYFELLSFNKAKYSSNETSIGSAKSKKLKDLAKMLDIPIIVIAPIRKGSQNSRPVLDDLKGSGNIGYDCDTCLFLFNPKLEEDPNADPTGFNGEELEKDKRIAEIEVIIAKSRNGSEGSFNLRFLKEYYLFEEDR